jgi:hypothetical protein
MIRSVSSPITNSLYVRLQGPERWFTRDARFSLRPALVILKAALILDTNWRLLSGGISEVASSDLQQGFT